MMSLFEPSSPSAYVSKLFAGTLRSWTLISPVYGLALSGSMDWVTTAGVILAGFGMIRKRKRGGYYWYFRVRKDKPSGTSKMNDEYEEVVVVEGEGEEVDRTRANG